MFFVKKLYDRYMLTWFYDGRSDYSVGRPHIRIFSHGVGLVVMTLVTSYGAYAHYSVCDVYKVILVMVYVRAAPCIVAAAMF
jgi:hypothetical protein